MFFNPTFFQIKMNSKDIVFLSAAFLGLAPALSSCSAEKPKAPNVIFILADDMGIGDLGCYGQEQIPTPNIDRLAAAGVKFNRHYSGSTVSAPSRCVLLTGKHTGHSYIRGNKGAKSPLYPSYGFDNSLAADEVTVAELAREAGYATMCVGKWGLGAPESEGSPKNQGFDYFFGYLSQAAAHRYYPDHLWENDSLYPLDGKTYSHFLIVEKGLEFMRNNFDKPIFAYFAVTPPHADLDYPDISQFEGKFNETPYVNNNPNGGFKSNENPRATYAAMVAEVDKNVGQIVDLLEENGELDNTIIIFSSDNGVHSVGGHDPKYFNSNMSLRGVKRDLYEGGVRTPFVVRWDGVIEPGTENNHISAFWDFMPTLCEIIGVETPQNIDGISYLPTLKGEGEQATHDHLYYEFYEQGGKQSVLKDDWKLVRLNVSKPDKMREELYNLNEDMAEQNSVIEAYPEKAAELRQIMQESRVESDIFKFKK